MLPSSLAQRILQRFPTKLSYCFAYGSGVKKQSGYDDKAQSDAMIDLILCVDDAHEFHKANLKQNPRDYSWMRFLGAKSIAEYQGYAAGVYFNTLIPLDKNCTIKYGVITTERLCDDLYHWTNLYIAGRLHKPVQTLVAPTKTEITDDLGKNFKNVLHASLLMLPAQFSYYELFHMISFCSYVGDFRMLFGEKKDKVKNIVEPQLDSFLHLYAPHLKDLSKYVHIPDLTKITDTKIEQDKLPESILYHCKELPTIIQNQFVDMETTWEEVVLKPLDEQSDTIKTAIAGINWKNSLEQSVKNIPTAGIIKSLRYSGRKALKTFKK